MPEGVIVKSISSRYSVKTDDGIVVCGARGRLKLDKKAPLVGDRVEISLLAPGEYVFSDAFDMVRQTQNQQVIIIGKGPFPDFCYM